MDRISPAYPSPELVLAWQAPSRQTADAFGRAMVLNVDTQISSLLGGRIAVVTGAGSGIGAEIARTMARVGATVVAVDRRFADKAATLEALGAGARAYEIDVTDRQSCDGLATDLGDAFGRVDILVNSAGIVRREIITTAETARATWDEVLTINLTGTFNVITALAELLKTAKGSIVNLGSIQSFVAGPGLVAYGVSKGGIRSLTTNLAAELSPHGVRVNAVAPGLIETPMTSGSLDNDDYLARFASRVPLGVPGKPSDVAWPVIFLSCEMSRYITGVTLPVDGGFLCF